MPVTGLIVPTCLLALAALWAILARKGATNRKPLPVIERVAALPAVIWAALAVAAFVLPVLEYWITAKSHGNALAGFLPWADATEYFQCSQILLMGTEFPDHCGKRPYYFAFFADLLWLTGNRLQAALLLQALILGATAALMAREVTRLLGPIAAIAAYAVLYAFAAALCSGLVMTENAGLALGILGMTALWIGSRQPRPLPFAIGLALLAAAVSARPGPMFVLPVLLLWYVFYADGGLRSRLVEAAGAGLAAAIAIGIVALPAILAGGTLGSTHSNFSYALYGLVVGGENWQQVFRDHPELLDTAPGAIQTNKVYALALEAFIARPDLFLAGYIKGFGSYIDDLFRTAAEFKPLRLAGLIPPWTFGVWYALRHWREPAPAMLLFAQAGILLSSPFIIVDETNRTFAATAAVDALFVAYGFAWLNAWLAGIQVARKTTRPVSPRMSAICITALVLPVILFAAIPKRIPQTPEKFSCEAGTEYVLLQPGKSTLVLPLVGNGEEKISPLAVNAEEFVERQHRRVAHKDELRLAAGQNFIWAIQIGERDTGRLLYLTFRGEPPSKGEIFGFCVAPPKKGKSLRTATLAKRQ